jgi:hypothetical protein
MKCSPQLPDSDISFWAEMSVIIALLVKAANTPETSVDFYQIMQRNVPEDNRLPFRKFHVFCFFMS